MRLMVVILFIALLVMIDQFRFRGYYGAELSRIAKNAVETLIGRR